MRKALLGSAAFALLALAAGNADAGQVRLCTGDVGSDGMKGVYAQVGDMIRERAGNLDLVLVENTGGTVGNIARTAFAGTDAADACDAFIGQPDGVVAAKRSSPGAIAKVRRIGGLHREYAQLVCNKASGVDELTDLEDMGRDASIALGGAASGAALTWGNLVTEDDDYGEVQTVFKGGIEALSAVAAGEITCLLRTAGIPDPVVADGDTLFGEDTRLVEFDDADANDATDIAGNPLYAVAQIPGGTYPESYQSGWFGDIDTISWEAAVYVNIDRVQGADLDALTRAVAAGGKAAKAKFGG